MPFIVLCGKNNISTTPQGTWAYPVRATMEQFRGCHILGEDYRPPVFEKGDFLVLNDALLICTQGNDDNELPAFRRTAQENVFSKELYHAWLLANTKWRHPKAVIIGSPVNVSDNSKRPNKSRTKTLPVAATDIQLHDNVYFVSTGRPFHLKDFTVLQTREGTYWEVEFPEDLGKPRKPPHFKRLDVVPNDIRANERLRQAFYSRTSAQSMAA